MQFYYLHPDLFIFHESGLYFVVINLHISGDFWYGLIFISVHPSEIKDTKYYLFYS